MISVGILKRGLNQHQACLRTADEEKQRFKAVVKQASSGLLFACLLPWRGDNEENSATVGHFIASRLFYNWATEAGRCAEAEVQLSKGFDWQFLRRTGIGERLVYSSGERGVQIEMETAKNAIQGMQAEEDND